MPTREFVEELAEESTAWVQEGLITPDARDGILGRYADPSLLTPSRERARDHSALTVILYTLAGLLVGAATLALFFTLIENFNTQETNLPLLVMGILLLGAGAALKFSRPGFLFAESLLIAAIIPLATASVDENNRAFARPLLLLAAGALALYPHFRLPVSALAIVGYGLAGFMIIDVFFEGTEATGFFAALVLMAVLLASIVTVDRHVLGRDRTDATAVATIGLGIATAAWLGETMDMNWSSELIEVALGLVMLVVMGIGLLVSHRGIALGAAAVIAVDAIVFAFDVGGVFLGTVSLLAVAGLLIWQAEFLKRYLREAGRGAA
ncbi:MAG TPA: hypothetical protein VNZ52_11800 [Candidatus Thermoplasmatota archaeon]|nr:hypothetical protein [Candidatus Thermoplasmatota archaeon]